MDLYGVLGVSRAATAGEIERAYRRLARRYHPGVNPGDAVAQHMYECIGQAYRVLVDPERRQQYDRAGQVASAPTAQTSVFFEGFDFSAPAEGPVAATFSELFADVFRQAAQQVTRPGTLLAFLEPLYKGGLDGVTPGSSCIANAYSNNHDIIVAKETGVLKAFALHAVDALGLVHALILRLQALVLPFQTLVFGGH